MPLIPLLLKGRSLKVIWLKYNNLVYFYFSTKHCRIYFLFLSTDALLRNGRETKRNIRQERVGNKEIVHYTEVLSSCRNTDLPSVTCKIGRQAIEKTTCSKMDIEGEMEREFVCLLPPSSIGQCLPMGSSSLRLTDQIMELPRCVWGVGLLSSSLSRAKGQGLQRQVNWEPKTVPKRYHSTSIVLIIFSPSDLLACHVAPSSLSETP